MSHRSCSSKKSCKKSCCKKRCDSSSDYCEERRDSKRDHCRKNKCDCKPTPISCVPITITESGRYCVTRNLIYEEAGAGAAITIAADDVSIDFNSHSLLLKDGAATGVLEDLVNIYSYSEFKIYLLITSNYLLINTSYPEISHLFRDKSYPVINNLS